MHLLTSQSPHTHISFSPHTHLIITSYSPPPLTLTTSHLTLTSHLTYTSPHTHLLLTLTTLTHSHLLTSHSFPYHITRTPHLTLTSSPHLHLLPSPPSDFLTSHSPHLTLTSSPHTHFFLTSHILHTHLLTSHSPSSQLTLTSFSPHTHLLLTRTSFSPHSQVFVLLSMYVGGGDAMSHSGPNMYIFVTLKNQDISWTVLVPFPYTYFALPSACTGVCRGEMKLTISSKPECLERGMPYVFSVSLTPAIQVFLGLSLSL